MGSIQRGFLPFISVWCTLHCCPLPCVAFWLTSAQSSVFLGESESSIQPQLEQLKSQASPKPRPVCSEVTATNTRTNTAQITRSSTWAWLLLRQRTQKWPFLQSLLRHRSVGPGCSAWLGCSCYPSFGAVSQILSPLSPRAKNCSGTLKVKSPATLIHPFPRPMKKGISL